MASLRSRRKGWIHGLFGFDVFVSYTRRDARSYAQRLAMLLMRDGDYLVFLDDHELEAGAQLGTLLRAVRKSRMLVLLASPAVAESEYVPHEVATARRRKRRIVPVDLHRTLAESRQGDALGALLREEKWEPESNELDQGPSPAIVEAILRSGSGLRRRRLQQLVVSAVTLLLAGLSVLGFVLAEQRAQALELESIRAEQGVRLAYGSRMLLADAVAETEPDRSTRLLDDELAAPERLREITWRWIEAKAGWTLWQSDEPDPDRAAIGFLADGRLAVASRGGGVRAVDPAKPSAAEVLFVPAPGARLVRFSPGQRLVVLRAEEGALEIRSIDDGRLRGRVPANREVFDAVVLDEGRTLATVSRREVRFWVIETGLELAFRRFRVSRDDPDVMGEDRLIEAAPVPSEPSELLLRMTTLFIDEGDELFAAYLVRLRADGTALERWAPSPGHSEAVAAADDGLAVLVSRSTGQVASGEGYLSLQLFPNLASEISPDTVLPLGRRNLTALALEPSGRRLAVATSDGALNIRETRTARKIVEWTDSFPDVEALAFDESGSRLALLMGEGRLRVLRTTPPQPALAGESRSKSDARIRRFRRLPDGRILFGWSQVAVDALSGMELVDSERRTAEVVGTDSQFGRTRWLERVVLGVGEGRRGGQEDEEAGDPVRAAYREAGRLRAAVTPDGEWLVEASDGRFVHLPSGREADHPLEETMRTSLRVAFAGGPPRYARVRYSAEAEEADFTGGDNIINSTGPWVLETAGLAEGVEPTEFWHGAGRPQDLAFSPDGRWLAFADGEGPARLWDTRTGRERSVGSSAGRAVRLAFVPSSGDLVVASEEADVGVVVHQVRPGRRSGKVLTLTVNGVSQLLIIDRDRAVVGAEDGSVTVVDFARDVVHRAGGGVGSFVTGLELSDDRRTLLVSRLLASEETRCTLADPVFGHDLVELTVGGAPALAAAFLPQDAGLLLHGVDGGFHLWELPPGGK